MDFLYAVPTIVVVGALVGATLVATIIGNRIGRSQRMKENDRAYNVSMALKGSVLGLVALLLGFTYSMTSARHDQRQRVALDEANAIGTCYLRAGLLPDARTLAIRDTLRRYTDLRIDVFNHGLDDEAVKRTLVAMNGQLDKLWSAIEQSAKTDPEITRNSFIVPAANDVIDLSSTRVWAARNHVPASVILLLGVCMVMAGGLTGQSFGQVSRRGRALWTVQNVLIALVLYVILDFDRPRRGLIQVDHQPLFELRASMK